MSDEFNADNFDHTGGGFFGGYIPSAVDHWRRNTVPNLAPGVFS